jgi:hypothetical protein
MLLKKERWALLDRVNRLDPSLLYAVLVRDHRAANGRTPSVHLMLTLVPGGLLREDLQHTTEGRFIAE